MILKMAQQLNKMAALVNLARRDPAASAVMAEGAGVIQLVEVEGGIL
jgi:hypothetical protein